MELKNYAVKNNLSSNQGRTTFMELGTNSIPITSRAKNLALSPNILIIISIKILHILAHTSTGGISEYT